ncbi:MAG: M48 family metallopeptidase [Candidatus Paceibacterota bacterium]
MQTLYTHQSSNIRKTWLLITIFLVVVIALGYFLSIYFGSSDILYIAVIFAFFQVFFSYWFSHKIVLSMTGAKEVKREEHRELWNVVENLAITAGLPMPKLYIISDSTPNAFATGRNKEHAVVAVTTGLLERLDRTELEGVIAHELSHIGNKDMLVSTLVVVLVGFITLLSDMFLRAHLFGGGRNNDRSGGGQVQLVLMVVGVVLMILSPLIATLIQLSISRKREFLADASGALLTRYPEGLASALEKISVHGGQMKKANHATAHLFISNPFGSKNKSNWFQNLWATHPPVEERVKRLRSSD